MAGLRPTPDRIRETLFNWLQFQIAGAACLDLFAGSGAMSFEALSRGASKVVAIDYRQEIIDSLGEIRNSLGAEALHLVCDRTQTVLSTRALRQFDIVFIDPPFDHLIHNEVCKLLQDNGWLSAAALVFIEAAKDSKLDHPHSWSLLKAKRSGNVKYLLLRADD